jgi:ABC-type antimicrobial peptide transport system permease subunit
MSVVGTFRSLGFSPSFCTKLLLMEHALYGILGSLVAILLYLAGRDAIFNSIFAVEAGNFEVVINLEPLHPLVVVVVLLLGVFVMCACPLKEILSSSKMAIRDIIFNNKDTAYQSHKSTLGVGILCAAAAGITFFMKGCVAAQIVCFIGIILAIALLFPWILKVLTGLFAKLFDRLGMPVAHMAAVESYARKSTVGGAVLGVTASTLAIILFILVSTLGSVYDLKTFDCDVHASLGKQTDVATLSYIKDLDGVEETEILYKYETGMQFNGTEKTVTIFGLNEGGFSMFTGIANCPAKLEPDSFLMDESLAKRVGLEVGDTVEVMFDAYSYLPVTKKLKLAGLVDAYNYDTTGNVVVLPMELYIGIYHDYPGEVLVRCENPEQIVGEIKKYSGTAFEVIETVEDYNLGWEEKEKGTRGMLYAVIIFGVGLTVIGMISNQLIGFEGRKRECAVLASTSMTRGTLSKMLLLESMIAAGIALALAFPCALLAFVPFRRIMESFSAEFRVVYHLGAYGLFLGILWLVFTLVALFPVRSLRKMNLAEQLKYE